LKGQKWGGSFLLFILLLSFPVMAQEGGKLKKIRIGTTTLSMSTLPIIVGRKQGFYASEGLNIELIVMGPDQPSFTCSTINLDNAKNWVGTIATARSHPCRKVISSQGA
jgi:hypothetical protein